LFAGGAIMAWAAVGLYTSDTVEQSLGLVPSEQDRNELREAVPKLHVIEREKR
jgi:hypothetical protein